MFKFTKLNDWCLTGTKPAFYDTESATAIEQTAKLYGAVKTLIDETEKAINSLNETVELYKTGVINDFECFKAEITKITHDYVAMIDEKIRLQDVKINDSIVYIKENLEEAIKTILNEMSANGELDDVILTAVSGIENTINGLVTEVNSMNETFGNAISGLTDSVSQITNDIVLLKEQTNVSYNEETETLTIGGVN